MLPVNSPSGSKRSYTPRGANRACVAVAHTIIVIVYNMIKNLRPYYELGDSYFEKRPQQAIARKAIKQLEDLGYKVTLEVA